MGEYVCFLITVFYKSAESTLDCALKVKRDSLPGDCAEYPMEPENKECLHGLLPDHVRSAGPIITIENLFEVRCV